MNFKIINNNKYIIKLNSELIKYENIDSKEINKILNMITKRYGFEISGFYIIDIYQVNNFLTIIELNKKDDDDFYRKTINYKINKHKKEAKLIFDDILLLKEYNIDFNTDKINRTNLNKKDVLRLCEHYDIIY